ncbi:MAG: hypothetical protein AAF689_12280 [Pseudomonadota bacterium]
MRSIICISLLAAGPAVADGLGCYAASGLTDQPVDALSLYVFHNAARQGRYAAILADGAEIMAPCPTDRACIAPAEGGSLAIFQTADGIEIVTDHFAFGGVDLGNGSPIPERYALSRADADRCRGPA